MHYAIIVAKNLPNINLERKRGAYSNAQIFSKYHIIEKKEITMKKWKCTICGYVHVGQRPPSHCPICGVGAGMFEEVKEKLPDEGAVKAKTTATAFPGDW